MARRTTIQGLVQRLVAELSPRHDELAKELGVSYSTLYSWSVGRRYPDRTNALMLADVASRRGRGLTELASDLRRAIEESEQRRRPGPPARASAESKQRLRSAG